jgi:hypothetical protein
MKKFVLLLAIFCLGSHLASAQKDTVIIEKDKAPAIREMDDIKPKVGIFPEAQNAANAVDPADVGEADSFGKNVKFLGTANAGLVIIYTSCDPAVLSTDLGVVLGPDDRCLAAPDPNVLVSAQFNDIGRIKIPKNSVDNIVYLIGNHTMNYELHNANPNPFPGSLSYSPSITIESEALNDPAAIDPNTGLPMNGSYTSGGIGTKTFFETLAANASKINSDSYSRANTTGLSRQFFTALGLPNHIVNQLYKKPMTIHLNVRLSCRLTTFGQFQYSIRALGN